MKRCKHQLNQKSSFTESLKYQTFQLQMKKIILKEKNHHPAL